MKTATYTTKLGQQAQVTIVRELGSVSEIRHHDDKQIYVVQTNQLQRIKS